MIFRQPLEELHRLALFAAGNGRYAGVHFARDFERALAYCRPVDDSEPDVLQHAQDVLPQGLMPRGVADPRHREVLPRLHRALLAGTVLHAQQPAAPVAGHTQHRVDHQLDGQARVAEHDAQ